MVRRKKIGIFIIFGSVVLASSLLIGYLISENSKYGLISSISAVFIGGNMLVGLYQLVSTDRNHTNIGLGEKQDQDSKQNEEDDSQETAKSNQIGPSKSLRPEQIQAQNELIRTAYDEFEENPFTFMLTYQASGVVEEVAEQINADKEIVSKVWQFCKDDEYFRKRGNSWRLAPKALYRAEELGVETRLDEDIQDKILNSLLQEYRDNPHHSPVGQETLLETIAGEKKTILQNLWFLCEKNYVEREGYIGGAWFEITKLGRRVAE
ncbi:hypothetical protein [Halonotius roseus]|uniref:Uncharacterized protein n=1 Tax=Halonotius roseus TaxID=2511997 RepID=A0A544QR01_9EURY|nr:hypothetical protein [Halonotius roseus]TQQ81869.1 hypothetical protein EWF95_02725 [Halonotius roseus]